MFVSWRLLGTDPEGIAFNLYRAAGIAPVRLNPSPISNVTHFVDSSPQLDVDAGCFVRPVLEGRELPARAIFTLKGGEHSRAYLSVPLQFRLGSRPNGLAVGESLWRQGDFGNAEHAFDKAAPGRENAAMSKLELIESEVRRLPLEEALQLQDWLADYLEDDAEIDPAFVASIQRGKADLCEGRVRLEF